MPKQTLRDITCDWRDKLPNDEAAAYLGVQPGTLQVWRCTKRYTIPYLKIGSKVYYRRTDLDSWLQSRVVAE